MGPKLSGELENFARLAAVSYWEYESFKTSKSASYKQRPFVLIIQIIEVISFNLCNKSDGTKFLLFEDLSQHAI